MEYLEYWKFSLKIGFLKVVWPDIRFIFLSLSQRNHNRHSKFIKQRKGKTNSTVLIRLHWWNFISFISCWACSVVNLKFIFRRPCVKGISWLHPLCNNLFVSPVFRDNVLNPQRIVNVRDLIMPSMFSSSIVTHSHVLECVYINEFFKLDLLLSQKVKLHWFTHLQNNLFVYLRLVLVTVFPVPRNFILSYRVASQ